jgi:hypothetical protein
MRRETRSWIDQNISFRHPGSQEQHHKLHREWRLEGSNTGEQSDYRQRLRERVAEEWK